MSPPPVPADHVYTRCYCEENIYTLADALNRTVASADDTGVAWDAYVVFVSNHQKTVALWHQKAREGVVVWDYHVVLLLRARIALGKSAPPDGETTEAWVYDFDSCAPVPCLWQDYMRATFPYAFSGRWEVPAQYVSLFRVVPAQEYLDHFVSDRSHMLVQGQLDVYAAEPPPYPSLRGRKASNSQLKTNLMPSFVNMRSHVSDSGLHLADDVTEARTYGRVLGISDFISWLSGEASTAAE
ncbi:N-terminal glutamine amidase-domain-containing protein [Phanerochaete sordida]|uniref:Protein N-terminal glutamine amidohydrolase n=1 Tax=Phanerochaete sordida TaxID=48140 RepID=A0A9P3LK49_9APHY|nr:N-terminal glutamine amidase-domain-containing protein [Phanerochaete sordida]